MIEENPFKLQKDKQIFNHLESIASRSELEMKSSLNNNNSVILPQDTEDSNMFRKTSNQKVTNRITLPSGVPIIDHNFTTVLSGSRHILNSP